MAVVGITGHRELTPAIESYVVREIRASLRNHTPSDLFGISCLADGADTIFAEALLEIGGRLVVVVPAATYRDNLPSNHHSTYDRLYSRAYRTHHLSFQNSDSEAHMKASQLLVDQADQLIAVWDGQPSRGPGGTADVIEYAHTKHLTVTVIWPAGAERPQ